MSEESTILILGEKIRVSHAQLTTDSLQYFVENPRVYSSIHGENMPEDNDELQDFIYSKMLEQSSVKNLVPDIEKHGGLLEPILVKYRTKEVIEGNSRLAAFRYLDEKTKDEKWTEIACKYVTDLTEEQQDAYLSQIHVKGKTPWLAFEKANFAYIRSKRGVLIETIAYRSTETVSEIKKRIETVQLMEENDDKERSHFSYYNELVRNRRINKSNNYDDNVKRHLLSRIKNMTVGDSNNASFTALDLRTKMPVILNKKKQLKKFMAEESTLEEAYQNSRPSNPLRKVRIATDKIRDIEKSEINRLEVSDVNALLSNVKRLAREVKRVQSMVEEVKKYNAE